MQRTMSWVGTGLQVAGVFMLSSNMVYMPLVFAVLLAGSLVWYGLALVRKDGSLALLNGVFIISNVIGLVRYS